MNKIYYYAMCSNSEELEKMDEFYHCVTLASHKEEAIQLIKAKAHIHILSIKPIQQHFNQVGYVKDIAELTRHVRSQNPIAFSKPIAFFKSGKEEQKNKIVSLKIIDGEKENFRSAAKEYLLNEAKENSLLLIDASFFNSLTLLENFGHRMHRIYQDENAIDLKAIAPYLLEHKDIEHFIQHLDDHKNIDFGNLSGLTLLKTDQTVKKVIEHLNHFTKVKIEDDDEAVLFHFTNHSNLANWLLKSEPETTSFFMKIFDEITFVNGETNQYYKIITNKEEIIENPDYPQKDGYFLLTDKQIQAMNVQ